MFKTNLEYIARPCLNKVIFLRWGLLVNAAVVLPIKHKFIGAFFSVGKKGLKASTLENLKKGKGDSQTQVQLISPLPAVLTRLTGQPGSGALSLAAQQQQRTPPQPRCI